MAVTGTTFAARQYQSRECGTPRAATADRVLSWRLKGTGGSTRLWKLRPWGGSRRRRDETAPPVRVRVRGFCEHEPSRFCHFAGVRYEPPQYGATAKAHDPVGARARSGRHMGESWSNKRRAERPFEAPGSIGCPWKDQRPRSGFKRRDFRRAMVERC